MYNIIVNSYFHQVHFINVLRIIKLRIYGSAISRCLRNTKKLFRIVYRMLGYLLKSILNIMLTSGIITLSSIIITLLFRIFLSGYKLIYSNCFISTLSQESMLTLILKSIKNALKMYILMK